MRLGRPMLVLALVLSAIGAAPPDAAAKMRPGFSPNEGGYIRHWIVSTLNKSPYTGPGGSDDAMRRAAADKTIVAPPADPVLGGPGPFGKPWTFYSPGENYFVESSAFYHQLTVLDSYAATDVLVVDDGPVPARLWAAGTADLWVNGKHVARHDSPRYMYPSFADITLPLKKGANLLVVRLQALGVRDTRMLFGVQVTGDVKWLAITLPSPEDAMFQLWMAESWLQSVAADGRAALVSKNTSPTGALVKITDGPEIPWPKDQNRVALDPAKAFSVTVSVKAAGQTLERLFEIPANRPAPLPQAASMEENRRRYLDHIAASTSAKATDVAAIIARRMLGRTAKADAAALDESFLAMDARKDCADFGFGMLLRLHALGLATAEESARIKAAALAFRYWTDEPGTDAMCFGSENHSLLFHGAQLIAGRLWPEEKFSNSGRTGREQAALGAKRCLAWLDAAEKRGYSEFLSSTYMPLTAAALMNLVDFSGDEAMSRRAAAQVDRIFTDLALQAFDGVTVGPQGRVYRNVLTPQTSGTQGMLSLAATEAVPAFTSWSVFELSSKAWQPPAGLADLMARPATKTYRHTNFEIALHKTGGYLLTSVQVPASFSGAKPVGLQPGQAGYQQHLWQATLGRDCHVFVNHPGSSFEMSPSRPGYWYGNGSLPRLVQREGMMLEIFDIPDAHPMPFTHAHWPTDAFDRQEVRGQWAFGAKGKGYVALWSSAALKPHNEVLTGRELRAPGRRAAWLCVCDDAGKAGTFEAFVAACEKLAPAFDAATRSLRLVGREGLEWK